MTDSASTLPNSSLGLTNQTDHAHGTAFKVLGAISFSHLLNDMIQSLILAIYPVLKGGFHLSFGQIGLITLVYQITASLLQPMVVAASMASVVALRSRGQ